MDSSLKIVTSLSDAMRLPANKILQKLLKIPISHAMDLLANKFLLLIQ